MVEEHSMNIKTQIESEYSPSNAVHVTANHKNKDNILDGDFTSNTKLSDCDIPNVTSMNVIEKATDEVDMAKQDLKKNFKNSKPSSIDSKRSKSLCNTSSLDSSEDSKAKKENKSPSNPIKHDNQNDDNEVKNIDETEIKTSIEEKVSPTENLAVDFLNMTKPESPKAGSSTQQDHGKSQPF